MIAVLDTSAAVRVVLNPEQAAHLRTWLSEAEVVMAPELMIAETANTFWKYFRAGILSRADCERGCRAAVGLADEFARLGPLAAEALDLAVLSNRPAYDMFFLVLARRNGALLLTADDRLRESARSLGVRTE
jgi:predicted nucleic acid-binding protein